MTSTNRINQYLRKYFASSAFRYEQILGFAHVNKVYTVFHESNTFVLRVNEKEKSIVFKKEQWCINKAINLGIPTSPIIDIGNDESNAYSLMPFIEGVNCSALSSLELPENSFQVLGNYAKLLAEIKPDVSLDDLYPVDLAKDNFINNYLGYELKQTKSHDDYLEVNNFQKEIIVNSIKTLLENDFDFVLCHGDISLMNTLYSNEKNIFYLIDFGCAETHIKDFYEIMLQWLNLHYDKLISQKQFSDFILGITGVKAEKWLQDNLEIIKKLALVYCLDKYRWAYDHHSELWEEAYKKRFYTVLAWMN